MDVFDKINDNTIVNGFNSTYPIGDFHLICKLAASVGQKM